jgi:transposase
MQLVALQGATRGECMFGKLKHYRRIFSRFEKTMRNFMGMLTFAATLLWLR